MIPMLRPMRIVSRVGTIIGLLVLIVGIGVLGYGTFQIWQQYLAISADRSKEFVNPLPTSLLGTLVIAVGAFLFGLSLHRGVPKPDVKKPDGTTIIR
ncbi:hypothetical protein SAMN06266982_12239 [Propioniciclava tarda]|nr:hypothetical protein SAMN06266982_12239 [Propioniciclava tarda]